MVELSHKRDSLIKALSGGQRKRASIAVELLSDPNLLFLDEPASGLDPGTERNLMHSLRQMADSGKTVILVTHSTLQLQMCDKIVFMGAGGNLCFCGSYDEALAFFQVDNIVDIYNMITNQSKEWSARYSQLSPPGVFKKSDKIPAKQPEDRRHQLKVLCSRYVRLILNDRQRLWLLLLQAPLLAALISIVADGDQFEVYEMTKSLLFALSCCAFWVGILNAIQEICKERTILKREYMTGLSLGSYVRSKIIVLGSMCLLQSAMIVGVFAALVGLPEDGIILVPLLELLISVFLTALSAAAMGLFVSSMFDNADRAMTLAPILLMPQILFSGQLFKLEGATSTISWFATCRWSMEGLGTTADLYNLPTRTAPIALKEDFYDPEPEHLLMVWGILVASVIIFLILSKFMLRSVGKKK
jgi:energy-coupling factor transporter ATP-binding protein EcfA2